MAIWPFNRRKTTVTSNIPPEVQAYSRAEHRERMGVAWMVGVISLVVSAAVLAGLFFGGRWVYRKIAGTNKKPTTSKVSEEKKKKDQEADAAAKAEQQKQADEAKKRDEEAKAKADTEQPSASPTPAPETPATPAPIAPSTDLPRTGPDQDL